MKSVPKENFRCFHSVLREELQMLFSKKDLQKLIIPLMFEQLLAVSVGMVDTLMVSQASDIVL